MLFKNRKGLYKESCRPGLLPAGTLPAWLAQASAIGTLPPTLPWFELLEASCFYPCCSQGGHAMELLSRNIAVFVLVDDKRTIEPHSDADKHLLHGYELQDQRQFNAEELWPESYRLAPDLTPTNWEPPRPRMGRQDDDWGAVYQRDPASLPALSGRLALWRRREGFGDDHGLPVLCILRLRCEASLAYQLLYLRHQALTFVLFLRNPGSSPHNPIERFTRGGYDLFSRTLRRHPRGLPPWKIDQGEFLLYPDYEEIPAWSRIKGASFHEGGDGPVVEVLSSLKAATLDLFLDWQILPHGECPPEFSREDFLGSPDEFESLPSATKPIDFRLQAAVFGFDWGGELRRDWHPDPIQLRWLARKIGNAYHFEGRILRRRGEFLGFRALSRPGPAAASETAWLLILSRSMLAKSLALQTPQPPITGSPP